jgi:hypothetical protein
MARHRFRGFGEGDSHAAIAGPLIGGGATQIGIMLAHLHARKNPAALRHAGVHGAVVGLLVGGGLAMTKSYRQTGYSALATVAIMTIPRILEGFMGLGHREETAAMHGLGIITPQALQGAGEEPVVQLLDSNEMNGALGVHVAEELHGAGGNASEYVEMMGAGFGHNFLSAN